MVAKKQEIECLKRLFDIGPYLDEIVDFLILEGLMGKGDIPSLRASSDEAKYVQAIIQKSRDSGALLMSDFEWQILPYERIKIYFVTSRMQKEILYNNV